MKKKLMIGMAVGFLVFCMVLSSGAATIELHITGQLGGITEVEFADGTLWDATFYNQWTLSSQNTYSSDFAQNASIALYNLFNTSEFELYDFNPQMTWGIESQTSNVGYLITPTLYGSNIMFGYAFLNNGGLLYGFLMDGDDSANVYIAGYNISNWPNDQDNTHSYVQWTQSATGNSGDNPVPEPATMLLFGLGLLGLAGVSRRKK